MTKLNEVREMIREFNKARDWDQFHTPANLAKSIVIESAELLECFQWNDEDYDLSKIREELADVLCYCMMLCGRLHLDPAEIMEAKIRMNAGKYPVEKSKGKSLKYDQLESKGDKENG